MNSDLNKGKSLVGKVSDYSKTKGWFFGQFMEEDLLKSDLVEIAWQKVPNLVPSTDQAHLHKKSVEINIVIAGEIQLKINGQQRNLAKGDFYVVWPESVVSDITTDDQTELIVVRAPSINDKVSTNT